MRRYLYLTWISLRASLMVSFQYRAEFLFQGLSSLLMNALTFLPLLVIYGQRPSIGGWSFGESLLVLAFFVLLYAFIGGAVNPGMLQVTEQVRQGTLDFVLMKPADSQFLVSTAKFEPSALASFAGSLALFGWAFAELKRTPPITALLLASILLLSAMVLIHSLWLTVVSTAIRFTRVDNLVYLFTALYDTARWPTTIFKGVLAIIFTYVLPIGLMTTWPAAALLDRLTLGNVFAALATTLVFAVLARRTWMASLRRYTSASS